MPVHIYCKTCDREFTPTTEKLMELIRSALVSKTETLVLNCEACARCESENAARRMKQARRIVRMMRCPEAGCPGWVCRLEESDGTHFQCGECGEDWTTQQSLDGAIDRILERYDHRLSCYRMVDNHWAAAPPQQESPGLDGQIEREV